MAARPANAFVQISPRVLAPRLPELGAIKIGGKGDERTSKKGTKYRLPVKYDHFVITRRERDGRTENLVRDDAIHAVIGDKPRELDVRLLWDRPEDSFQSFLAAYDGRSLACRGNGEQAVDTVHGPVPCTCPWFKGHEGPYAGPARRIGAATCKPHGRLNLILEAAQAFGGYYVFRTTSWETISNLSSQLALFHSQFGFIAGLPLKLVIYPATDSYQEGGETKTSTSYKVALLLRADFDTARQIASTTYERRSQLALPSPAAGAAFQQQLDEADAREAEEIAQEFHPETAGEVAEAEIVDEVDPQADQIEEICRYALELADWAPKRINAQIAKYSTDLQSLATKLQETMPREWEKAHNDITGANAGEPAAERQEEIEIDGELVDDEEQEQELEPEPEPEPEEQPAAAAAPAAPEAPAPTARTSRKPAAAAPLLGAEELL